jgi:DNA-binding beta-propeller fold protein YncE
MTSRTFASLIAMLFVTLIAEQRSNEGLKRRSFRMRLLSKLLAFVPLLSVWGNCPPHAAAQTVVATIPNNGVPRVVAVNPVTNKVYVANCNVHLDEGATSSITVIDGATNSATSLAGACPAALAVNTVTNKIYFPGGVIDGATNSTTDLPGAWPFSLKNVTAAAVNPITNKIYVGGPGNVTVIDGATNSATTVTDPNAIGSPSSIAVNSVTNKIYVANYAIATPGNVTVIDGATNAITTVTDPNAIAPVSIAVNSVTNKIYVANQGDSPAQRGNITVIDGATNATTTLTDPNVEAPQSVAVNETTNTIYVVNANNPTGNGIGGVSVITGATNSISTVTDPNAINPIAVAVDSASNMIYVANQGCFEEDSCKNPGNVTVINGATNAVTTVINPNASNPFALALDSTTNSIYVASANVTVIDGAKATSHLLLLALTGSGAGMVTSTPAGINCTASCSASFAAGSAANLTASPASGATFSGWSTNCTGTGDCDLTMNSDEFVTATFTNDTAPDFSIQIATPSSIIQPGSQATEIVTIAPAGGTSYGTAIQLSCAVAFQLGAPITNNGPMPTCAVSPSSVTPGTNSVTSTLTVTAPMQSAVVTPFSGGHPSRPPYAVFLPIPFALIGLGLASGKSRNQRSSPLLLCGLFITFVALQAGCGGGSGSKGPSQQQNYTVTATSSTIQHITQVTVIVP